MITSFQTLSPAPTADDAAELLLRTTQQEFPVVDGAGILRGMLTREALIARCDQRRRHAGARRHGPRGADRAGERQPRRRLPGMQQREERGWSASSTHAAGWSGYITPENLSELMMIRSARSARREAASAAT